MALPPFRGTEGVRIANRHLTPPPRPEESRFRQYVAFSTHPSGEPSRHFRRDVLAARGRGCAQVARSLQHLVLDVGDRLRADIGVDPLTVAEHLPEDR